MKWNEVAERKWLNAALKVMGVPVDGQTFLLVPIEGNAVQLVHGGDEVLGSGVVVCDYQLEDGETIDELAEHLGPLLDGARVLAPTM